MPLTVLFIHGWGFDAGIWSEITHLLTDWPVLHFDRGYFGAPRAPSPDGPCLVVTHSFGTMLALRDPPPHCIGILAINGFDRFFAKPGSPGVHPRILKRMIGQFDKEPEEVLREFRNRCGCDAPFTLRDHQLLGEDLERLATLDCTTVSASIDLPILSLQSETDPILPKAMRDHVFAGASRLERKTLADGGHLLPLTEPEACASTIRDFAGTIA